MLLLSDHKASFVPRPFASSLLALVVLATISLSVYASVPGTQKIEGDFDKGRFDVHSKVLGEQNAIKSETTETDEEPNQDESAENLSGISLADAVKAFNEKHNRNSLGNSIEFHGIDPRPLTVDEVESALKRVLSTQTKEPVSQELISKIREIAKTKRLQEHFSISPTMGFTPNDFTKITSWRIMLSYNIPGDRKSFRAFVIRDWGDKKNRPIQSTDSAMGPTEKKLPKPWELTGKISGLDGKILNKFDGVVEAYYLFQMERKCLCGSQNGDRCNSKKWHLSIVLRNDR